MKKAISSPRGPITSSMTWLIGFALSLVLSYPLAVSASDETPYHQVPGLIDLRSSFSDGAHGIEELVRIARSRGFKVLFINDHDRISVSYGLPPFRRIVKYTREYPSIATHGTEKYLNAIRVAAAKYRDTIIIPGCITSPFYYWTGSWVRGNLTLREYDRKMLILNFEKPEDYEGIPSIGNDFSLRYTKTLLPGVGLFLVPLVIGVIFLKWKGRYRLMGIAIIIISALAIIDYNPFRGSLYHPYAGDQGIGPYQELINYVRERGGYSFWNYPEQRSGIRRQGPIRVSTPPYPQVIHESQDYTGFAAIYGDRITLIDPGREWDRVLNEFCAGERRRAPWAISTADFHEEGRWGLKLGAYPTTFLVREFSKKAILEALEKGRMYCSRSDGRKWPRLDYFHVSSTDSGRAYMGETLNASSSPLIKFKVSYYPETPAPITILLIRGGELVETFTGRAPLEIEYVDRSVTPGKMTFYRIMDGKKHLTSNPIFVVYRIP
ncbi:MAG: hypothetical protein JRJ29_16650 [Deltaproteobacteria bacterium]|nr:hypothetical protein [Deltaproteobacteria bacterium]